MVRETAFRPIRAWEIAVGDANRQHITIEDDGRPLAHADLEPTPDRTAVTASIEVEHGHLPGGTRARVVDAVVDSAASTPAKQLQASTPLGDTEMLDRLRERCTDVEARPAGGTCLVDGTLPAD
jgi:hypothetical protein